MKKKRISYEKSESKNEFSPIISNFAANYGINPICIGVPNAKLNNESIKIRRNIRWFRKKYS